MGWGSKLKKAFKKVTKKVKGDSGLFGSGDAPKAPTPAPETVTAPTVEVAKEEVKEDEGGDTEASKKRSKATGKRGLSVTRSSGSGINL